jgi:putative ABC transport system substrate-binding protein
MNRSVVMISLALLFAFASLARAQPSTGPAQICFLTFDPGSTMRSNRFGDFFNALSNLGYRQGKNVQVHYLSAEGRNENFPVLADECVKRRVNVIVATSTPAALAAKKATSSIPIVTTPLGDPVGSGVVDSLSHPTGNITGTTFLAPALAAKRVELLREAVPGVSRILVLSYLIDPIAPPQVAQIKAVADRMGIKVLVREIRTAADLTAAFEAGAREKVDGLLTTNESIFMANRQRVIELAAKYRLPGIYWHRAFAHSGGFMIYGADYTALYARSAAHVDKVLNGVKPSDLPIEQPTRFELVINLRTAKTLGISVPQSLLVRADQLIE